MEAHTSNRAGTCAIVHKELATNVLPGVALAQGVGRDVDVSSMKQIIGESHATPPALSQEDMGGLGGTSSPAHGASTSTASPKSVR